jgi:hypothetical protein
MARDHMSGRRLAALLAGVVLLLVAACGPLGAFIAWIAAKLDGQPGESELRMLAAALGVGVALVVAGALSLRFYVRTGQPNRGAVVTAESHEVATAGQDE